MIQILLRLYIFLLPYELLWELTFNSATQLKPYRIVGGVLTIAFIMRLLVGRARLYFDTYDKVFGFLLALSLALAFFWSVAGGRADLGLALQVTVLSVFALVLAIVVKCEVQSLEDVRKLWDWFIVGLLSSLAISLVYGSPADTERLVGLFENPNSLALSLDAAILFLISTLLSQRKSGALRTLVRIALLVAFLFALLFTGSRGGLAGLAIGLVLLVIGRTRGTLKRGVVLPIVLVSAMLGGGYAIYSSATSTGSVAVQRLDWESAKTGSGRLDIWRSAWIVAQDHYLLGIGASQYRLFHKETIRQLDKVYERRVGEGELGVHSDYMNLLVHGGIISLVLYLGMLFFAFKEAWRLSRLSRIEQAATRVCLPMLALIATVQITAVLSIGPIYFSLFALVALGIESQRTEQSAV